MCALVKGKRLRSSGVYATRLVRRFNRMEAGPFQRSGDGHKVRRNRTEQRLTMQAIKSYYSGSGRINL